MYLWFIWSLRSFSEVLSFSLLVLVYIVDHRDVPSLENIENFQVIRFKLQTHKNNQDGSNFLLQWIIL